MRAGIIAALLLVGWLVRVPAQDAPKRFQPPDVASVAKGQKAVQEVFGRDIEKAKTVAARKTLAVRMLGVANDPKEASENRWVLYIKARDLAADAGDVGLAMQTVDDMQNVFEIESKEIVAETAEKLSKTVNAAGSMPLLDWIERTADEALRVDDYKSGDRLLTLASRIAQRNPKDTSTAKHFESRLRRAKELAKEYDDVSGRGILPPLLDTDGEICCRRNPDARLCRVPI